MIFYSSYLFFSACIGSFLGVFVDRYPGLAKHREDPWSLKPWIHLVYPASHCPYCHQTLNWLEMLPILGYCGLRGSCWTCRCAIPCSSVALEICSLLIGCAVCWLLPDQSAFAMILCGILGWSLLALAALDIRYGVLPDLLTLPLLWLGLITCALGVGPVDAGRSVLGGAIGYGVLWGLGFAYFHLRKQYGIGGGDLKLAAALGAWSGPLLLCLILWGSSVLALFAIGFQAIRGRYLGRIVYGPFLGLSGGVLVLLRYRGLL